MFEVKQIQDPEIDISVQMCYAFDKELALNISANIFKYIRTIFCENILYYTHICVYLKKIYSIYIYLFVLRSNIKKIINHDL